MAESMPGAPNGSVGGSAADVHAALRASEERRELAERATGVGVFDWDLATGRAAWSAEIYRLHGLAPGTPATEEAWLAAVHPDDRAPIQAAVAALREGRRTGAITPDALVENEYRVVLPDGAVRWIASRLRVIAAPDGRLPRLLGVNFDVTERKRVEAALRASEQRLRLAIEVLAGFLYDADLSTNRVTFFRGVDRVLGFEPAEAPPDLAWWRERVHPDDVSNGGRAWQAAVDGAAPGYVLEYRVRHRDGHYVDVVDRGRIIRDDDGRAVRVVGGTTDVSERRRLERERAALLERERAARAQADDAHARAEEARAQAEEARARADQANRAKGEILARMSHELRTPLNATLGYAKLLDMGLYGLVTAEQQDTLARITRSQQHLLGLINSILQFAELEAGRGLGELADVPLTECCAEVDALVGAAVAAKHLTYTCHLDETGGPLAVRGDRANVLRILLNLVTNAVKYTGVGGTVAVEAIAEGSRIAVHVRDTGRGIPADQLEAIFQPFVQVDRTRTSREGVGLGLAIGRELARGMGGEVTVSSAAGAGSTFTLTLARASAAG